MIDVEHFKALCLRMWDSDPIQRRRAIEEVGEVGPSILPELVKELDRLYRRPRALKSIMDNMSDKMTAEQKLAKIGEEIERWSNAADKTRCPECLDPLDAHVMGACRALRSSPRPRIGEELVFCGCNWQKSKGHA